MDHPSFDKLITAMGRETGIEVADTTPSDPTLIPALIEASKHSKPKNRARKASWVLHHISDRHPQLMSPHIIELMDVLDESEDTSVYREILKIFVDFKLSTDQYESVKEPLYDLGIGLLYDDSLQKGLHYIAMRLVVRFNSTSEEKLQAIESISELIARSSANDKSLCNAAQRVLNKLKKSIS